MNTHLKKLLIKCLVIICALVFLVHFEVNRLGSDTYFGVNVRSMTIYYVITGMIFGGTRDFLAWKQYDESIIRNRKMHVYFAEIIISTVAVIFATKPFFNMFLGSDSCTNDPVQLPVQMYEGVCIAPDIEKNHHHSHITPIYSFSGSEYVPKEYFENVIDFSHACLKEHVYMLGQTIQFLVVLYQTELFYLNHEMRIELQIHHMCAVLLSVIPFYTNASTAVINICYANFYFAMFEQPVFLALIIYRFVEGRFLLKKRLFQFASIFWVISKVFVYVLSIYVIITEGEDYMDSITKWLLLVLCTIFMTTQWYTLLALNGLAKKCHKLYIRN